MDFFNSFSKIFFKMQWLWDVVEYLVVQIFGMSMESRIGESVHFFIYDVIKIFILLSVMIFFISLIQSYFPPEKTKRTLGRIKGIKGNILGALLGILTPFCSCSSIPIFIGFISSGLPLGATFSFLIASPMMDLAALLIIASTFGIKIGMAYVLVGIFVSVVGGLLIGRMDVKENIHAYVWDVQKVDGEIEVLSFNERLTFALEQVKDVFLRVWPYILIGVGIGAGIHNWIPEVIVEKVLGPNNPFSVLIATFIGIPMYADILGTIPIAEALIMKGVGVGTVVSFMMGVTLMSIPSLIMLSKVVKKKLLAKFIVIGSIGIIIVGYGLNILSIIGGF